ncbi:sugar kinase [Enterococcus massiliensis]|uniref:sugar kinase n=1 Tax=Enterococcus massiliensis TaxID=1640685 RepID=UPI00065E700C|nr:sugar kinase [Enterococcus massiliensis]
MKIGAFGEVMLRLTPPEHLLLEQTHSLRMAFTGTGVNLVGNLAHFGLPSYLLTALPDNRLGEAAKANLKALGIDTRFIVSQHQHMGTYFAEMGYGPRPTQVTYQNRISSSFGLSKAADYDFSSFVEAVDLVHICGISLSLTEETAEAAIQLAKTAHEKGKKVCFDFNFRPSLNQESGKKEIMKARYEAILPYCTIVFGAIRDLTDLLRRVERSALQSPEDEILAIQAFLKEYGIDWFAGTSRKISNQQKAIDGYVVTEKTAVRSAVFPLTVLDRIGAGDAYAAGILLGYAEKWSLEQTVAFAIANSVLAHTIQGDVPLTTREQVDRLLTEPETDLVR